MNQTITRFGYPATLVADYDHWVMLLRPEQPTLGSLVLAAKTEATAFADLPPPAFAELAQAVADLESVLLDRVGFAKINYLMLMMVDPNVHFHVLPRYEGARSHGGVEFVDHGWPKQPDLGNAVPLGPEQVASLVGWLRDGWPAR